MKKNHTLYALILFFSLTAQLSFAQLFPVQKPGSDGEQNGYINSAGKLFAPYNYSYAAYFSDSLGMVSKYDDKGDGGYGFLNQFGREVIPTVYDDALAFRNGYTVVERNDSIFVIDKKNKKYVINNLYMNRRNFVSDGLIGFESAGKKGYVGLDNKVFVPAEFDVVTPFSEGFAITIKDKKIVILDRSGKQHPTEYIDAFKFSNGIMPVKNAEGKWGVINNKLETVIGFKYDYIDEFSQGFAPFETPNKKWGMMNEKGDAVLPATYTDVSMYYDGRLFVLNEDKTISLMDESFKVLKIFDATHEFASSLKFEFGVCAMTLAVTDPKNKDENIRNYGGYAYLYINKNGEKIWQGETFYSCFPANSSVKMADFSTKNIQDIKKGDEVLTYNQETKSYESTKVNALEVHTGSFDLIQVKVCQNSGLTCSVSDELVASFEQLTATPNHPVLTASGVKLMGDIVTDDVLFVWNESMQIFDELKVVSTEKLNKTKEVFNLKTDARNYLVNSVVVMMK